MRILRISFQNLNSLAGKWHIDLDQPSYRAEGIFAITGPTGAGKSTILDAICLALYGQTPRLGRISAKENEVMSRQTAECYAEVCFKTEQGCYCSRWSQRRANNKPQGKLQNPKLEIFHAGKETVGSENGPQKQIIASGSHATAEEVERLTGMNFSRFTRSMLLAQGEFARFLNAPADERAPVLEQITGTDIYSRLSIRTHQKNVEERKKLEELANLYSGQQPLTEEEENARNSSLAEMKTQISRLGRQIEQYKTQRQAQKELEELETELTSLQAQEHALQENLQAFEPKREQLRKAKLALELAADYSALAAARQEAAKEQQDLQAAQNARPALEKQAEEAQGAYAAAGQLHAQSRQAEEKARPLLQQARDLDLRITEKQRPLAEAEARRAGQQQRLAALLAAQKEANAALLAEENALEEIRQQLKASGPDSTLPETLAGLIERFSGLGKLYAGLEAEQTALKSAESALNMAESDRQATAEYAAEAQARLAAAQQNLATEQGRLKEILQGQAPQHWHESVASLSNQLNLLLKAEESLKALEEAGKTLAKLAEASRRLAQKEQELTAQSANQSIRLAGLEKEESLLATQLELLQRIAGLDAQRAQLADGTPCPLCGSLHHPFASGNIPAPDQSRQAFEKTRSERKLAEKALSDLRLELSNLQKDQQFQFVTQKNTEAQSETARQNLRKTLQEFASLAPSRLDSLADGELGSLANGELGNIANGGLRSLAGALIADGQDGLAQGTLPALKVELAAARGQKQQQLEAARQIIESTTRAQQKIEGLAEALKSAEEQERESDQDKLEASYAARLALAEKNRLADSCREAEAKQQAALRDLASALAPYSAPAPDRQNLAAIKQNLQDRRDAWLTSSQNASKKEKEIPLLQERATQTAAAIKNAEQELGKLQNEKSLLEQEMLALQAERTRIFGGASPQAEEERLQQDTQRAEQAMEQARERMTQENQSLTLNNDKIKNLRSAINDRANALAALLEAFAAKLAERGIAHEQAYLAMHLPEEARNALDKEGHALDESATALTGRKNEKAAQLAAKRASADMFWASLPGPNAPGTDTHGPNAHGPNAHGPDTHAPDAHGTNAPGPNTPIPGSPEADASLASGARPGQAPAENAARLVWLAEVAEQLENEQQALQQAVGGILRQLEENAQLKENRQEQLLAIEAQKAECARWEQLDELIGSADGKKYRNFAQGLTFEIMVRQANRQLSKMTDRYLLTRHQTQPLELNIIDNYQAGEVRSTKNLSGGESFLVSLALALGLSGMASQNVRVDSLFLDEGFGTLDEDALETALESLSSLQQDGKIIGVISHVSALKERITTQIQVQPQSGGRSRLFGPGCKQEI